MTFKYKHKKTPTSKTQLKEEKRTRYGRERESTPFRATAELLSAVSPPLSRWHLGGSAALFNLETTAQSQRHHYDKNLSRTSEEEQKKKKKGAKKLEKTSRNMSKTQIRKTRKNSRNISNPNQNQ